MTLAMRDGTIRGLFCSGQNPAVGGSNSRMVRAALAEARLAGRARHRRDRDRRRSGTTVARVESGELRPQDIGTEVFLMPAALAGEKDGTFTNTQRLVQWHDKVVEPPGDSRSELWFVYHLGPAAEGALRRQHRPEATRPIQALTWDYPTTAHGASPIGRGGPEGDQRLHRGRPQADRRLHTS